jgi:uncharacterized membrane protein YkvA (DUF1232 family)
MRTRTRVPETEAIEIDDLTIRPTPRAAAQRRARKARRQNAKRSLMGTIRQIPAYLRLLAGLLVDGRVGRTDKLLVAGAFAYLLAPIDFIPDIIPFLGQVDDLFLVITALNRLVGRAGRSVLLDHWVGDPEELSDLNFARVLAAAAVFLPPAMRRRLRRLAR